jgi:SAM-dependent methyltransferase
VSFWSSADDAFEYYRDGAWYDAEYVHIGGDIAYYERVARETEGPLLELAAGTGRLTLPMARATPFPVVGVDLSEGMIAQAEHKRAQLPREVQDRLRFVVADMRALRLPQQFQAVVLAFNTLMHMTTDQDLEAALETARAHLREDGLFHLDLHTPYPSLMGERDPAGRYDPQQLIDPHTRERWQVSENNSYDAREQINRMSFYYQRVDAQGVPFGEERRMDLRLRVIFPRELDRWLYQAGFEVVGDWEDLGRTQRFSGRGGRRVVACRLR